MNWIEGLYELKGKDAYSQNGEGIYLEYIFHHLGINKGSFVDIGAGDGFNLSNTRHLKNLGWDGVQLDRITGHDINTSNIISYFVKTPDLVSIDIDGNDYFVLDKILTHKSPAVIIAEFNAMYTDSRTIKYNPDHEWAGDSYYGFTFEAGVRLANIHEYRVIFQNDNMNMYLVKDDLIKVDVPPVTYKQNDFFKLSERTDWIWI